MVSAAATVADSISMETAATLVVSRYKSPAGIGESERHALHCGLWLKHDKPLSCQDSSSSRSIDGDESSSSSSTTMMTTWTGYSWIDHPAQWTHLQSLLERHPISLLHLHAAMDKKTKDRVVPAVARRLEDVLKKQALERSCQDSANHHDDTAANNNKKDADDLGSGGGGSNGGSECCSVRVEVHDSLTKAPLPQVLKRHGISPMHILPQLDTDVIQLSALLALSLTDESTPVQLALGRMPRVMHVDAATARETLHVWPPATQGEAVAVGGTIANNSLYGLLASGGGGTGGARGRQYLATVLGRRCWATWLDQPLCDLRELELRQDAVGWFVSRGVPRDSVHSGLAALNLDVTHLAQQLSNHRATLDDSDNDPADDATPQDGQQQQMSQPIGSTRKALQALYHLYLLASQKLPLIVDSLLSSVEAEDDPSSVAELLREMIESLQRAEAQLRNAASLAETVLDLEQAPREFLVRTSYRDELQDLKLELDQTDQQIAECLEEINDVWNRACGGGGGTVKLESTTGDGHQFRLADGNAAKVLAGIDDIRVHRILKNGVYFSTHELDELSTHRADLIRQYEQHQRRVVSEAMPVAASFVPVLDALSPCLAQLDVLVGLALLACHRNYCRPVLTDYEGPVDDPQSGNRILLEQARHPCVELHMEFIPNSVRLERDTSSFVIMTGPNMGGKSTYLRALGAIVTLAQVGSFVPCSSATIQLVDAVLARVGAGDQQDRGISTFMAEMLDSAAILNRATSRSLILIDELGRGTSTYDGYGLARGISEYILNRIQCFAVFTTHFHELTALQESHRQVVNYHVTAQKSSSGLIFLYQVQPGPCLESFGIQVAEMAQMPDVVLEDAKRKALELERFEYKKRCPTETGSSSGTANESTFMAKFRQVDIRGILQRYEGASDDEKRQAILLAMGVSSDVLQGQ